MTLPAVWAGRPLQHIEGAVVAAIRLVAFAARRTTSRASFGAVLASLGLEAFSISYWVESSRFLKHMVIPLRPSPIMPAFFAAANGPTGQGDKRWRIRNQAYRS